MLDISKKVTTRRTAIARARLRISSGTAERMHEQSLPKGDPFPVAKVAAMQAAKSTPQLIPYCHPIPVEFVGVDFELTETEIIATVTVTAIAKTGVEMEALTGASVAALTLYDMLKPIDDALEITGVILVSKKGGKSDFRDTFERPLKAAVVVMSDSVASGKKSDESGRIIMERLRTEGFEVADYVIIPDDATKIKEMVTRFCDEMKLDLVLTTGGTGLGPRDCTPEAMQVLIEREVPGITEAARAYGQDRTPRAMLSRGRAGVRGQTLIINLPGSRGGVTESLDVLFPGVLHAFHMLWGEGH